MKKTKPKRNGATAEGRALGKMPVSAQALLRRINRALAKESKKLRKTHSNPMRGNEPRPWRPYFIINDGEHAHVTNLKGVSDLATFARELGVLKPWETVS
jgi:hypothetical protein